MNEHLDEMTELLSSPFAMFADVRLACPDCRVRLRGPACACGRVFAERDGVLDLAPLVTEAESFYEAPHEARYGHSAMPEREQHVVRQFLEYVDRDSVVVEIGSGRCFFEDAHPNLILTDFSGWALATFGDGRRIRADAQRLPFADGSIDALFSIATLEHVPYPELALAEVDRVLAPRGRALLFPAWLVYPWRSSNLERHQYSELRARERLLKALIPFRSHRAYRFAAVLPRRLVREAAMALGKKVSFTYRRLDPNFSDYLTSDSDAYASMDPHACAAYFVSRGYRLCSHTGTLARLTMAYVPVEVVKPA